MELGAAVLDYSLDRLLEEVVTSTNTAAAGGNADLMALPEEGGRVNDRGSPLRIRHCSNFCACKQPYASQISTNDIIEIIRREVHDRLIGTITPALLNAASSAPSLSSTTAISPSTAFSSDTSVGKAMALPPLL